MKSEMKKNRFDIIVITLSKKQVLKQMTNA